MKEFFSSILYSWGSEAPEEVFWSLNDLLDWAKTKGFKSEIQGFVDPLSVAQEETERVVDENEQLTEELVDFFETLK